MSWWRMMRRKEKRRNRRRDTLLYSRVVCSRLVAMAIHGAVAYGCCGKSAVDGIWKAHTSRKPPSQEVFLQDHYIHLFAFQDSPSAYMCHMHGHNDEATAV